MTTQDELATTSTVPTAATDVPSGTAGTRRITHGPTTRPSAMPIGKAAPTVAARPVSRPASTSRATDHTTKLNSADTASVIGSHRRSTVSKPGRPTTTRAGAAGVAAAAEAVSYT